MRTIDLTQGKYALVDDENYDWLMQWKWSVDMGGVRYAKRMQCNGKKIYMHRLIMGTNKGDEVDHIDNNGLNNTRDNLRFCTHKQNTYNAKSKGGVSKYKGVVFDKRDNTWNAHITVDGKYIYLGKTKKEKLAAQMYDYGAREYFGEFAKLNFPYELLDRLPARQKSSMFRGVSREVNRNKKWRVSVEHNGKRLYNERFSCELIAAIKYDEYALKVFGDKAKLNFG